MSIRKREWTTKDGPKNAWVVDYKDQHGKRRLKTFARKKDADAWWKAKAAPEIHAGTHTADSASITVAEAAENWIAYVELEGRERSTVTQYRQHVALHLKPRIGAEKLSKLTTPRVQALRDELLRDLSRPMAKKVLTSLKSLLNDAMRRGSVAQNVALAVSIKTSARDKQRLRIGEEIPSPQEIKATLAHASDRWRPLLVTAVFTGMRASELRGLTWANVDFENKLIHVRQRADYRHTIGAPKSEAGERSIPMIALVMNALLEWQERYPRPIIGKGEDGEPIREEAKAAHLVFPTGTGRVESHGNIVQRGLWPAQVTAGVVVPVLDEDGEPLKDEKGKPVVKAKYPGLHALRHFYASWCINRRADGGLELPPKTVQERLGHASVQLTLDTYSHLFPSGADDWQEMSEAGAAMLKAG